jgi:hypothetical protein
MRFRTRSAKRDQATDMQRLESIERVVARAIAEAEAERAGLEKRYQSAQVRASMLVGNDTYGDLDRDDKTEALLTSSEREFCAAGTRLRALSSHVEHLRRISECLRRVEPASGPATDDRD